MLYTHTYMHIQSQDIKKNQEGGSEKNWGR